MAKRAKKKATQRLSGAWVTHTPKLGGWAAPPIVRKPRTSPAESRAVSRSYWVEEWHKARMAGAPPLEASESVWYRWIDSYLDHNRGVDGFPTYAAEQNAQYWKVARDNLRRFGYGREVSRKTGVMLERPYEVNPRRLPPRDRLGRFLPRR